MLNAEYQRGMVLKSGSQWLLVCWEDFIRFDGGNLEFRGHGNNVTVGVEDRGLGFTPTKAQAKRKGPLCQCRNAFLL